MQAIFTEIDVNSWSRKYYFEHYYQRVKCTYSLTAAVEIGRLLHACKQKSIKLYPVMLYIIARAVNEINELRVDLNAEGQLGVWDFVSPCYTVFHEDDKTFTNIWTTFDADFSVFHHRYLQDMARYSHVKEFIAKPDEPGNTFPISCIPWIDFSAFNLNIYDDASYLKPIFTIGKYTSRESKISLPLSIQCHHAICDGYHAGFLLEKIRGLALLFEEWL